MSQSKYEQYTKTYSGRELLKNHFLSETGIWQVLGEDPNCDYTGSHHNPELGVFDGTLDDVIRLAVELPEFWQWGAGGKIKKLTIVKVDPLATAHIADIREKIKELDALKKQLESDLAKLGAKQ